MTADVGRAVWSAADRYAECDQQGGVFNGHYLTWTDEAATGLMAKLGTPYPELLARGLDTSVVASDLSWSSSAVWSDHVEIDGAPNRLGRISFAWRFTVQVGERVCCTVLTTYVLVDAHRTPTLLPDDLREAWASSLVSPVSVSDARSLLERRVLAVSQHDFSRAGDSRSDRSDPRMVQHDGSRSLSVSRHAERGR